MQGNLTFSMIKPDSFKNGHTSEILFEILKAGFKLRAIKVTMLTLDKAEQFYEEHRGKEFFERLTCFMSSGPVMALILEKPDAVNEFRKLIGNTNPEKAEKEPSEKNMAHQLPSMLFMVQIVQIMLKENGVFSSQKERFTK